ncbi:32994_t:CDS:1, partial [Gigaspora margarita]
IDLILKKTVNLKNSIFQDENFVLCEDSTNTISTTSDTNMDFDSESLVDAVLDELAD